MNAAVLKNVLGNILTFAIPPIKKLIESKVVPTLKRKAYEHLDNFANDRIEDLAKLLNKIQTEPDGIKKQNHIEGFKLGLEAIKAIGQKLVDGAEVLGKEV